MKKQVKAIIEKLVRAHFGDANIGSVRVAEGADLDGDGVLWITVILTRNELLDAGKTLSFTSILRKALRHGGEERFPIVSYVSKADAKSLPAEAA